MAIVKRFNKLLDLDEIDVLIDEQDKSRHIIIGDMPDSLPQGRSSFSVEVSPFMRDGVELQIDFIDADGASIYTEPVEGYLEGTARRVSIEIYDDTAPGLATLIIVGELDKIPLDNSVFGDVEPPPPDFKGVYNVRLTKQVLVNPTATNTQPIRFFAEPRIRVTEDVLGTMVRSEVTGSITSSLFDVEGIPTDKDLLFAPFGDLDGEVAKIDFLSTRKFNICFESYSHPGYVTEKILHAFLAGTVPIYWGSNSIEADFNPKSFINVHNFNNFDEAIDYVKKVDDNDEFYEWTVNQPKFTEGVLPEYLMYNNFLNWFEAIVYNKVNKKK